MGEEEEEEEGASQAGVKVLGHQSCRQLHPCATPGFPVPPGVLAGLKRWYSQNCWQLLCPGGLIPTLCHEKQMAQPELQGALRKGF